MLFQSEQNINFVRNPLSLLLILELFQKWFKSNLRGSVKPLSKGYQLILEAAMNSDHCNNTFNPNRHWLVSKGQLIIWLRGLPKNFQTLSKLSHHLFHDWTLRWICKDISVREQRTNEIEVSWNYGKITCFLPWQRSQYQRKYLSHLSKFLFADSQYLYPVHFFDILNSIFKINTLIIINIPSAMD